ncbi:MAG: metallophosphoesterase family protein [Deltaproteobacteria bacterium]|nr:metallophosphoesterase family protein [Deltaproteobacteria bacterium]
MDGLLKYKKIEILPGEICGVISDTHSTFLPEEVVRNLRNYFHSVKYLLHLGDVTHPGVINDLEADGFSVISVLGNNDRLLSTPSVVVLEGGGYKVGMVHGGGGGYGDVEKRCLRIIRSVFTDNLDGVLFGHIHIPVDKIINGIRFMNPGSLIFPRHDPDEKYPAIPHAAFFSFGKDGPEFEIFSF